jgi:hypothetical protein
VAFAGPGQPPATRRAGPRSVRVGVRCRARCRARIELKLARRLARRYSLNRVIGARRVTLRAGKHSVKVKLRKAAISRLSGVAKVRLTAVVELASERSIRHRSRQLLLVQNRRH